MEWDALQCQWQMKLLNCVELEVLQRAPASSRWWSLSAPLYALVTENVKRTFDFWFSKGWGYYQTKIYHLETFPLVTVKTKQPLVPVRFWIRFGYVIFGSVSVLTGLPGKFNLSSQNDICVVPIPFPRRSLTVPLLLFMFVPSSFPYGSHNLDGYIIGLVTSGSLDVLLMFPQLCLYCVVQSISNDDCPPD